ncbi:MAG: type IV pilus modification protein PilV [Gammaproteobacteria bacterium]|nr:MAG: type IV pilus modification protein PilV [Gammaproteobacteria bacterium]
MQQLNRLSRTEHKHRWQQMRKQARKQVGMTFIEVLVALVILVTGILGAVAMQAAAKKGSFDAMQRSLASSLAQDIIERMRTNDSTVTTSVLGSYAGTGYGAKNLTTPSIRCDSAVALCTSAQRVTNDLYEWEQLLMGTEVKSATAANVGGLSGAQGCIAVSSNSVTVAISWQGRTATADGASTRSVKCGTSGSKRRQVIIQAFIF